MPLPHLPYYLNTPLIRINSSTPATSAFAKVAAAPNKAPSFKKFQSAVSQIQTFTVTVFRLPEQPNRGRTAKEEDKSTKPIGDAVPNSPEVTTAATGVASIMMKA